MSAGVEGCASLPWMHITCFSMSGWIPAQTDQRSFSWQCFRCQWGTHLVQRWQSCSWTRQYSKSRILWASQMMLLGTSSCTAWFPHSVLRGELWDPAHLLRAASAGCPATTKPKNPLPSLCEWAVSHWETTNPLLHALLLQGEGPMIFGLCNLVGNCCCLAGLWLKLFSGCFLRACTFAFLNSLMIL